MLYSPRALVVATRGVPEMPTRAPVIGAPEAESVTIPAIVLAACARAASGATTTAAVQATRRRMERDIGLLLAFGECCCTAMHNRERVEI